MQWIVRVERLNTVTLTWSDVVVFRTETPSQAGAEVLARDVAGAWLRQNPAEAARWTLCAPSYAEKW